MKTLGIKEFQARLTQLLRKVREEEARYALSYKGRVFAALVPKRAEESPPVRQERDPRSVLVQGASRGGRR